MWEDYGALASMIENINRRDLKEEADTYQTGQQAKKLLESPPYIYSHNLCSTWEEYSHWLTPSEWKEGEVPCLASSVPRAGPIPEYRTRCSGDRERLACPITTAPIT